MVFQDMQFRLRLYSFLVLQLFVQTITAQHAPLDFNLIKEVNGVTVGKITGITQDRSGYMWFADQENNCITRFDGYKMKRYKYDPLDSNSLGNQGIESIAADSSGYIWVGTGDGIDKFDPTINKFIHFKYAPNEAGRTINTILIDHWGIVWVGTSKGLDRLDQQTKKFIHYTHNDNDTTSLSSNLIRCLYEDHEGVLWVGTGWEFDSKINEGGLNRFNRKAGTFTRYMHNPNNPNSLSGNKVRAIFEDSRGIFWVGTDGDGLHIMDRKTGTFQRLTYDPLHPEKLSRPHLKTGKDWSDHITFITEDGAGAIWIGTYYAGLVRYDPVTKEITHYDSTDNSRKNGFTDNSTWAAYTSKDGVLWISTEGVDNSNRGKNLFRIDPLQSGISNIKMGDELTDLYEDSSGIRWMGLGHKGLLKINMNKNIKKYFKHDPNDPYSVSSNEIFFIKPGTNGSFWVGTWNGLNYFDSKTGRFTRYFYNAISKGDYADTAAFVLEQGNNGDIYISTNMAFIIMNLRTGSIKRYVNDPADSTSISANFATGLCKDKSGNLWVGTWSYAGLNLLDLKTKKFKHYLVGNIIRSIYKDTRGTIWVGTGNGLYYHNDSKDSFIRVDEWNKEFSAAPLQLQLEDDDKNLWGSSSLGIFRFNAQKHELCFYKNRFGINDTTVNHFRKSYKTADGELIFNKEDGYYSFLPQNIINAIPPTIILTDFKISDKSTPPGKNAPYEGPVEVTKEIQLQHYQNNFSIDFAAIHYSSPENNTLYYMLEGYDNKWTATDPLKTLNYYQIPTGEYILKIRARSSYGVWAQKDVKIIIHPPWWLTWWSITGAIILLVTGFYLPIRWWINRKFRLRLDHAEKEKHVTELEMRALRAQMNPHFIFNSLNSINMFILENNKLRASEYLSKFSKLIRLILQNSQEAFIPLESELESLRLYLELESLRFENKFEYKIVVNDDVDTTMLKVPPLIIQPYAENAIWHGLMHKKEKGHLTIELYTEKEMLFYKITDDGIGRKKAAELKSKSASTHKSMGMGITADRLAMLQKQNKTSITITDLVLPGGNPAGTEVLIKIPVFYD